jgi:hypothetical protein
MNYIVINGHSVQDLTRRVNEHIKEGWTPIGSHQVVESHRQNRYSGTQHMDTRIEHDYSQTLIKKLSLDTINVDISYYHPDDNENEKVYDVEGMREEFEYKLDCIIKNAGI